MCSISEENSSGKITEVTVWPVGREVLDNAHSRNYRFTYFRFSSDIWCFRSTLFKINTKQKQANGRVIAFFQASAV